MAPLRGIVATRVPRAALPGRSHMGHPWFQLDMLKTDKAALEKELVDQDRQWQQVVEVRDEPRRRIRKNRVWPL
jgi:hypothetical protein